MPICAWVPKGEEGPGRIGGVHLCTGPTPPPEPASALQGHIRAGTVGGERPLPHSHPLSQPVPMGPDQNQCPLGWFSFSPAKGAETFGLQSLGPLPQRCPHAG